jgi:prevent-host-death family protein
MNFWHLQEAQARLSEVIKCAITLGPQVITISGQPKAVVIDSTFYENLIEKQQSLFDFMQSSPLYTLEDIDFERDQSLALSWTECP